MGTGYKNFFYKIQQDIRRAGFDFENILNYYN